MKKKPGGISKKTDGRIATLLDALEKFMPFKKACDYAEIDYTTAWRWMKSDPDLAVRIRYSMSKAELAMLEELKKKDPKFWLKNMDSEHFKDEVPQQTQNNYKLIINTGYGQLDLSGGSRLDEESEAERRTSIE